jgi:outer membrane protein OmpA-like peptidoglycan-associated protein
MADFKFVRGTGGVKVTIGRSQSVEIPPRVFRGRLTGFLFETDKTFLLPSAMNGIRGLKSFYDEHPGLAVLVSGHTDTVGPTDYNRGLSAERADMIAAFLRNDVATWTRRWDAPGAHSKQWAAREDQLLLATLTDANGAPFYAGPLSGMVDGPTQDATRRYQSARGLAVDGFPGPETRRQLVTDYMGLEGTTLPAGTTLATHGCGKMHPAVPTADQTDEPRNRRVEIYFFEGPIDPPPQTPCPGSGCPEYPEWVRRTVLTIDFDQPLPTLSNARWEAPEGPNTRDMAITMLDLRRQPVADRDVTVLMVGRDERRFVHTDGNGQLIVAVPNGVTQLKLRYAPGDAATLVEVTAQVDVPAISDDAGVVARLLNLGYPADSDLQYAVYTFQRDFGLVPPSCVIDAATRAKVAEVHGS